MTRVTISGTTMTSPPESKTPTNATLDDCRVIRLPKISRPEGSITPIEAGADVPFKIARIYYIYGVPGGESRGGHAHRELEQLIVAVMGSFKVVARDGRNDRTIELRHADVGLYVPRLVWRDLVDFSH